LPTHISFHEYGIENFDCLLECGYIVDGIDASIEAKKLVELKLNKRLELMGRATLRHLSPDATMLPYEDSTFDYGTCLSVLSLLGSKTRAQHLLSEFVRVMRPCAKLIIDVNGPNSDFAHYATSRGNDIYETRGPSREEPPHLSYCPRDTQTFVELVKPFLVIDDVGYSAHKYFHSEIHEFTICAHKA